MLKKLTCIFCVILFVISFAACTDDITDEYEPKTYDVNVDYIGTKYTPSENVNGVTVYESLQDYVYADKKSSAVWIEESAAENDFDYIRALIQENSVVAVLSESDRNELLQSITGETVRGSVEGDYSFIGLLFVNVTGEEKNSVGLYTAYPNELQTDFLAFCTQYSYSARYQGDKMDTEMLNTEILKECFNAFNHNEQAYSVSFSTLVDYWDNPYIVKSDDETQYQFRYTVLSYTDVVPVKGRSSGFDIAIEAGSDGWVIDTSPNVDIEFDVDTDMFRNFFFNRTFDSSVDLKSSGILKSIVKGYGEAKAEWRISSLNKKGTEEIALFSAKNMTCASDFINLTGRYLPVHNVTFSTNSDDGAFDWSYRICIDEWAFVWEDDYEE